MLDWGFAFPSLTLRTSMGLSRFSVLRIRSNPVEASSSGRTDGGNDSLAAVVHRAAPRSLFSLSTREREKLTKFGIQATLNI